MIHDNDANMVSLLIQVWRPKARDETKDLEHGDFYVSYSSNETTNA